MQCSRRWRPIFGKVCDKYGLAKVFYPEATVMMLCPLVLAFADSTIMVALAGLCLAFGQGTLYPSLQAEAVRNVPHQETTLAINTFYIGADAGMAIGPIVSGIILGSLGVEAMYLVIVAVCVALMIAYGFYLASMKKKAAAATQAEDAEQVEQAEQAE